MSDITKRIETVLNQGDILIDQDVLSRSAGSWGRQRAIKAKAIVRPKTTEEVSEVMKLCHAVDQKVVVHGGLTGVVGGAITNENDIILSLERMDQIEDIDVIGRTATVQAGVILQKLQEEVQKFDLMFPLDLGARGSCQIGGNVATNAGGVRVIKYGVTRDLVLGLEAVFPDGTILSSLNKMVKNNAGYDLKHLFIGSEGTLGIVTRVVLRLQPAPKSQNLALVALESFDKVTAFLKFVDAGLSGNLSAFEVMWKDFYKLVTSPPAKSQPPLTYDFPYYVLVESMGAKQKEDSAQFHTLLEQALNDKLVVDAVIAQSQKERDTMWAMRDDVEQIWQYDPVFLFDVSLAIRDMEGYVTEVKEQLQKVWPEHRCFVFGHLGDGNLHFLISAGKNDAQTRRKVEEIVYNPIIQLNGSVSAEHGIGLEKKRYLSWCRSEAEIAMMRALKQTFDPTGILNPGRIFDMV